MATSQATDADNRPSGEASYALSLTGDGISVQRQVPLSVALQIVSLAMGGIDQNSRSSAQRPVSPQRRANPAVAIREFLDDVSAKRNPDKITAMAVYLRDHLGRESFSRDDVKALFRKAGEAAPANYARDFGVALSSGWIAEDHAASGEYYVTKSGDDALAERFAAKPARSKRKRKATSKGDQ